MKRPGNPFELEKQSISDPKIQTRWRRYQIDSDIIFSHDLEKKERIVSLREFVSFRLGYFIIILFAGLLLFRLIDLQIVHGLEYRSSAETNRVRLEYIAPNRGFIVDRQNEWLVKNIPSFLLQVTPGDLPRRQDEKMKLIQTVADFFEMPSPLLREKIVEQSPISYRPISVLEHIPYEKARQAEIQSPLWSGFTIKAVADREIRPLESLSHIIGYVSGITEEEIKKNLKDTVQLTDKTGKTGLEKKYENILRGISGKKKIEVDSRGKEQRMIAYEEPVRGDNLQLSLDLQLQTFAEEELRSMMEAKNSPAGSVIVMDPRDGSIQSLVSLPGFNANQFSRGLSDEESQSIFSDPEKPLFFRAISGEYPSGSLIKPLIGSGAIDMGVISPKTAILSSGGIQIGSWFFPDWKSGGHGQTNLSKAIAESVNTFFYAVGGGTDQFQGLGLTKLTEIFLAFGLSKPTGIDLPEESSGFIPTKEWKKQTKGEPWYIGDTYHMSIGQGDLLVTPLQIATAFSVIANNGALVQPFLVEKQSDQNGNIVKETKIAIRNQNVFRHSSFDPVKNGLEQAVKAGTARSLNMQDIPLAGKTGTAQIGNSEKTHAWFAGYGPASSPEIVVVVLVERGGEGHESAVPIAKKIFEYYFSKK